MSYLRAETQAIPRPGFAINAKAASSTAAALAILYARLALGAAFLSAVASRFGLWQGAPGMSRFGGFLQYTAEVNSFMPASTIPFLAWTATVSETAMGIALIVSGLLGFASRRHAQWARWTAWGSAALLALFGTAMAISAGLKSPLDYSVFSASACALLIAVYPDPRISTP